MSLSSLGLLGSVDSRDHLQDDAQSLALVNARNKNFSSLSTAIQSRIFVFLDLSDVAHCAVNRQTRAPLNSSFLSQEKLRQINDRVWERLSDLSNDFGVQVNWRVNLRQEMALRRIDRQLTREEQQMPQLERGQRAMNQRAQSRSRMALDVFKVTYCVFALALPSVLPGTGSSPSISGYTP